MNTKPRKRTSHHEGKPNPRRGTVVGLHPVFFDWLVPNCLHQGRTTYALGEREGLRRLVLHLAANVPFGSAKPPRALRIAVATIYDDTADAFAALVEATGVVPEYRIVIHPLRFDDHELRYPNELARVMRANNSDALLVEGGDSVLSAVRDHLGDFSGPLLSACTSPVSSNEIALRLHDDHFEVIEGNEHAK